MENPMYPMPGQMMYGDWGRMMMEMHQHMMCMSQMMMDMHQSMMNMNKMTMEMYRMMCEMYKQK